MASELNNYKIGEFTVQPENFVLLKGSNDKVLLQPKVIEVLNYLAVNYPKTISREKLIDKVWNGNKYVGDKALTNCVWQLRKSLTSKKQSSTIIETVRKKGYRLSIKPRWEKSTEYTNVVNSNSTDIRFTPVLLILFISVVIALIAIFFNHNQRSKLTITPVTQGVGGEYLPSASPDGRYLIYKSKKPNASSNLYMIDRHRPDLPEKQLTFDSYSQGKAVWSHDGKYIYFPQTDRSRTQCNIIRLNLKTLTKENITPCLLDKKYNYLDASPDGRLLAFNGEFQPDGVAGIYFLDLTKHDTKPVRFSCAKNCNYIERDMAFSPDGRYLAVTRRTNPLNENIYLVNIDTKEATKLTDGFRDIVGLTWHPEGKKLVFGSRPTDHHGGYVIDLDKREISPLNIEGFTFPNFSRQSKELFYQDKRDSFKIVTYDISENATYAPSPIAQSRQSNRQADYSSKSDRLAYISNQSGSNELWTSGSSGENPVKLTNLSKYARYPSWSNDGKYIAFVASEKQNAKQAIYIFNIYTRETNKIESSFNSFGKPSWSFDDSEIIASVKINGIRELHSFNIKSKESKQLTNNGGRYGIMISTEELLYSNSQNKLFTLDLKTNKISTIDGITKLSYYFTKHNSDIYYVVSEKNNDEIRSYNLKNKKGHSVLKYPSYLYKSSYGISFNNKNQKLYFTTESKHRPDIKILNHPLI